MGTREPELVSGSVFGGSVFRGSVVGGRVGGSVEGAVHMSNYEHLVMICTINLQNSAER